MKIRVTQKHINAGGSGYNNCPISLAMKDAGFGASVFTDAIFVSVGEKVVRISTPVRVQAWLDAYDAGLPVTPFTFKLEI